MEAIIGGQRNGEERKGADITVIMAWERQRPRRAVALASPDDVALQWTVLMALGGRLPLDHDGLIGAAAGDDCLWRGAGGLLGEGQPVSGGAERQREQKRQERKKKKEKWDEKVKGETRSESRTLIIKACCIFPSRFIICIKS